MKEKIKQFFDQKEDQKYKKYIQEFREKHVPERYNQIRLLDELNNPEIDHFMSISNRTDGKTFNYIHALLKIAVDYKLGLTFLSRNAALRESYQTLIEEIVDQSPLFEPRDFGFINQRYYVSVNYKGETIGIISDLNSATNLKYYSNYLRNFPIIIYDEFLALENDYLPDEWEKLDTIYQSIDRKDSYPLIHKPKVFYLGNAVNFSSPILAGLKLFNILEEHEINTSKMYKGYVKIFLEVRRNDNANDRANVRAFPNEFDSMRSAEFKKNDYMIATDQDHEEVKRNPRTIYVKLEEYYLSIFFNRDTMKIILNVETNIEKDYQFNYQLNDNRADSIFLNEKYFSEKHVKKIDNGAYLFENNFSKNFITGNYQRLDHLRINKIIRVFLRSETEQDELKAKEEQYQKNYEEMTMRSLMRKYWG